MAMGPPHAPTEVLITSATDALAFLVGATTVLPALSWFCTYAGGEKQQRWDCGMCIYEEIDGK